MSIEEYDPKSTLVVPEHVVKRAKYPFIDVHNHQDSCQSQACADKLVSDMDGLNLRVMVNLSGGYGEDELTRAGAFRVYRDPAELHASLDELGVVR